MDLRDPTIKLFQVVPKNCLQLFALFQLYSRLNPSEIWSGGRGDSVYRLEITYRPDLVLKVEEGDYIYITKKGDLTVIKRRS